MLWKRGGGAVLQYRGGWRPVVTVVVAFLIVALFLCALWSPVDVNSSVLPRPVGRSATAYIVSASGRRSIREHCPAGGGGPLLDPTLNL